MFMNRTRAVLTLVACGLLALAPLRGASVDIIVVVDESGSMSTEHSWLPGMISSLDAELAALSLTTNYGLFGYGGGGAGNLGRTLLDGGTAIDFGTAAAGLITSGGSEDGYAGLDFALNNFTYTGGVVNYILVTDEDRDNLDNTLTYASTLAFLQGQEALLNAVVNNSFVCGGSTALGIDSTGGGYQADGSGGFTSCVGGTPGASGSGLTEAHYIDLAIASGGAAWDLNQLRAGSDTATSFTNAFINIKVQEIDEEVSDVPEPGTILLLGSALACVGLLRRRSA